MIDKILEVQKQNKAFGDLMKQKQNAAESAISEIVKVNEDSILEIKHKTVSNEQEIDQIVTRANALLDEIKFNKKSLEKYHADTDESFIEINDKIVKNDEMLIDKTKILETEID